MEWDHGHIASYIHTGTGLRWWPAQAGNATQSLRGFGV